MGADRFSPVLGRVEPARHRKRVQIGRVLLPRKSAHADFLFRSDHITDTERRDGGLVPGRYFWRIARGDAFHTITGYSFFPRPILEVDVEGPVLMCFDDGASTPLTSPLS